MAVTLPAGLQTAQEYDSRKPLINLIAGQKVADIPFDGSFLTGSTDIETEPVSITLADGRVLVCYRYYTNFLIFYLTDEDRIYFDSNFTVNMGGSVSGVSIIQLDDGNIGIIYKETGAFEFIKYKIITLSGGSVSGALIEYFGSAINMSHMWVIRTASNYLLTYVRDSDFTKPTVGGTYTGSANTSFTINVTTSGTETTGWFKWKKTGGAFSSPIQMTGSPQALSDGVTITWPAGNYTLGQYFEFEAVAAIKATATLTLTSIPDDGDTVILGATTYTFKDELVAGGNPNEIKIDELSLDITQQDLLCGITDTDFEGTGEGVRYGNGTVANTSATGVRVTSQLQLEAITAGAAGNSITLTPDTDHYTYTVFAGGADSYLGAVSGGNIYKLFKRTSTNFTAWSSESEVNLGSLLPHRLKDSPSLTRLDNDDIMLFFAYTDATNDSLANLTNIYYMTSSDDGATWDSPTAITFSTSFAVTSNHPVAILRNSGVLYAIYTRQISSLRMDNSAIGWPEGVYTDWAFELSWDSTNRKLYVVNMYTGIGAKVVQCVVKVDVDTWTVDTFWDRTSTSPRLDPSIGSFYGRFIGDGHKIAMYDENSDALNLLNGEDNTVTKYYFRDNATHGYVKNTNWTQYGPAQYIRTAQVDTVDNRLYTFWLHYTGFTVYLQIGYFDLSDTTAPFSFVTLVEEAGSVEFGFQSICEMRVYPNDDYIFIGGEYVFFGGGGLRIYNTSGVLVDDYRNANDPQFPKWGMRNLCYHGGYLFGSFIYESGYGQANRRGIVRINLTTRVCTYHRPSWASLNDYEITSIEPGGDDELIITCYSYGVTKYFISSDTWQLFDNTTISDMIPDANYTFRCSAFDADNGYIFAGYHSSFATYNGIIMFPDAGSIIKSYYQIGTWAADHWDWNTEAILVQGIGDFDTVGAVDADDTMFCFWQSNDRRPAADYAIKWDADGTAVSLVQYLVADQDVVVKRTMDGTPNTLEFACSHGHLFDPFNTNSILRNTFTRGRKITLQWGENITGTPVYQDAGEFYVVSATTSYERGVYSKLQVKCEDDRTFWTDKKILVSSVYNDTPQNIITSMLIAYAGISGGDIDMPEMSLGSLSHQFVDVTLEEAINKICSRFGYYFTIDVDGVYTARKIDDSNSTDHTYYNSEKLLTFNPDNTYSNNINRIRVLGQEQTANVLSTQEEALAELSGTVGWWGGTKAHTVYYSEDRERRAQSPRLEVVETVLSIGFALGGSITEELTSEDPNGKFCTVVITSPNLTIELIAALALLVASYFIGDITVYAYTIPVGSYIRAFACWWALNILGATGNYSYVIHGYPYGDVRYSLEAVADDTVNQTETGYVVEQQVNDDLCYSTADCQVVADFEIMVVKLQRNTLGIKKITHLQDEEGDTIVFPHPFSGENMKMFVTELTRRFKKSTTDGDQEDGYFYDEINGWVIL